MFRGHDLHRKVHCWSRSACRGGVLTELAIVVPLLLLPLAGIALDYTLALRDHELMMRAAAAGGRAAVELASSYKGSPDDLTADKIFDAAEAAIKDFLNSCDHTIPGDCDASVRRDLNYKINMRAQEIPVKIGNLPILGGLKISLTRAQNTSFLAGRLGKICAAMVVHLPAKEYLSGYRILRCGDQRLTNPLNENPYIPNPCGCRDVVVSDDACEQAPCGAGGCTYLPESTQ